MSEVNMMVGEIINNQEKDFSTDNLFLFTFLIRLKIKVNELVTFWISSCKNEASLSFPFDEFFIHLILALLWAIWRFIESMNEEENKIQIVCACFRKVKFVK